MPERTPAEWQAAWAATARRLAHAARDLQAIESLLAPHLYEEGRWFTRLTDALEPLVDDLRSRALEQAATREEA